MRSLGFTDKIVVTVAIAAVVVALPGIAVAAAVGALLALLINFVRTRRWHRTPALADLSPGKPRWADRERQVAGLVSAIQALPIERFDTFEPEGVPGWTEIVHASDGAPRQSGTQSGSPEQASVWR